MGQTGRWRADVNWGKKVNPYTAHKSNTHEARPVPIIKLLTDTIIYSTEEILISCSLHSVNNQAINREWTVFHNVNKIPKLKQK